MSNFRARRQKAEPHTLDAADDFGGTPRSHQKYRAT
jgi:hypothetical protein